MTEHDSDFKIYKLNFPASAVFGESYTVVTGFKKLSTIYKGEYFTLTTRNAKTLNEGSLTYKDSNNSEQSEIVDVSLMIEESKAQAELFFIDSIYELSQKNSNFNMYASPVSLVECERSPFVGCWLRGVFHEEIKKIASSTECENLSLYLNKIMCMSPFNITKG